MTTAKGIATEGLLLLDSVELRLIKQSNYNAYACREFATLARAHIEQEARMRALEEIAHAAWHLLEDSSEDARSGEFSVMREDVLALQEALAPLGDDIHEALAAELRLEAEQKEKNDGQ